MLADLLSTMKEQDNKLRQYLTQKNPDVMKRKIAALRLHKEPASVEMQPLIREGDLHLTSADDMLKYSTVFDTSLLEAVEDVFKDSQQMMDHLAKRYLAQEELKKFNLSDCQPLNDEQQKQPPPPGYVRANVNLKNSLSSLRVEHLYSVKLAICDVIQVQPFAVLLCGFREGSTVVDVFVTGALEQEVCHKAVSIAGCLHERCETITVSFHHAVFM